MNPRAIIYFLGALLIFLAISMLPSVAVALIYNDGDFIPLISSAAFTGLVGLIFFLPNRIEHELTIREGFALVTFTWLAFALFGSIPFYISGQIPSFTDAFFETMSGFTTTGATILTNVEEMSHGLLFWRSFTHWLGGMGIILLSLAILPLLGVGGMQLYKAEVPGPEHDKLSPKIKDTAKILWVVYIVISLAETILLYIGGMDVFESLCHTFGTMATGGFSTKNASIGYYNSAFIDYVIVIFMLIAGINFSLHYQAFRGNVSHYWKNPETIFFLTLIAGGTLFIGADIHFFHDYSVSDAIQKSMFQTVSIITTTGYGTDDYELWGTASQIILFIFMFLGGCAGSTGGAMKIIRSLVLIKYGLNEIKRLIHPHAVLPVRIGHRTIPREIVSNIGGFFLIYMLLFIMGVLSMAILGLDFESAFGSVAATIGNIGPGLGSVGPTDNYAHIPEAGKWILSFMMLVGRLEIYPVIVMLTPAFWKK
jgi:trk system potassium uptake protein